MVGSIIGDIVGSTYEFHNTKDYNFDLFPPGSEYTDDTICSLAIASWLMKHGKEDYRGISGPYDELQEFGHMYPSPKGGYGSGFATWLFTPKDLRDYEDDSDDFKRGTGYNSYGNGAAMRVAPVGWFFREKDRSYMTSRKMTIIAAQKSAEVTHNHKEGLKGAAAVANAIHMALSGKTKEEIKAEIEEYYGYDLSKSWDYWYRNYKWDGSCQGTVPQAMIAFLESTNFEDAIRKAVSLGGDSDTLACITGGIAEAYYKEIPRFMLDNTLEKLPAHLRGVLRDFMIAVNYDVKFI